MKAVMQITSADIRCAEGGGAGTTADGKAILRIWFGGHLKFSESMENIVAMKAENQRLRDSLTEILELCEKPKLPYGMKVNEIARSALNPTPNS